MELNRKIQVHMLPTEDEVNYGDLCTSARYGDKPLLFGQFENSYPEECKKQYLYYTSDEKPKEGDWVLLNYPSGKEIKQMVKGVVFENAKFINAENTEDACNHRKIIGTTDTKLKVKCGNIIIDCDESGYDGRKQCIKCKGSALLNLPQPSQSFIEAFCKAGGIYELLVEYTGGRWDYRRFDGNKSIEKRHGTSDVDYVWVEGVSYNSIKNMPKHMIRQIPITPKVNSHNEITIHLIKDSWNKEEVIEVLSSMSSYTHVHNRVVVGKELNNWIKENL